MIDNQIPALHTSQVNIAMTVCMSRLLVSGYLPCGHKDSRIILRRSLR